VCEFIGETRILTPHNDSVTLEHKAYIIKTNDEQNGYLQLSLSLSCETCQFLEKVTNGFERSKIRRLGLGQY
jgi:hypothetical protein